MSSYDLPDDLVERLRRRAEESGRRVEESAGARASSIGVGIALSEGSCWMPAAWVGRAAADYIIPQLEGDAAQAAKARLDRMYLYPDAEATAFFGDAGPKEVQALVAAAERGLARARAQGPVGLHDPQAFPVFLRAFEELLEYLRLDPRLSGQPAGELVPPAGRSFRVVFFK